MNSCILAYHEVYHNYSRVLPLLLLLLVDDDDDDDAADGNVFPFLFLFLISLSLHYLIRSLISVIMQFIQFH